MDILTTPLAGLLRLRPRRFEDARGWFMESFNAAAFDAALQADGQGPAPVFVQDNHSCSRAGVLRGLHFQVAPQAQGKLVRVARGAAWDVVVDLRPGSATRGRWHGQTLDADQGEQLWIPPGFAHGFLALADDTHVLYKTTAPYAPACERTLRWNDPRIAIAWPLAPGQAPLVAARDAQAPGWDALDSDHPDGGTAGPGEAAD